MSAIIRKAEISDHQQLLALFADLDRLHRENVPWLFQEPGTQPRPEVWLQRRLEDESSTLLVADAGDVDSVDCIGVVTVALRGAPPSPLFVRQSWAVIDDLFVAAAWRRAGLARALCEAAEAWARERGARWIEANVYDFNVEAQSFYDGLGFSTSMRKLRKPFGE